MSSQAKIQTKYLFYESVKTNKYADFVYKDLEGVIDAQDNIQEGKNPGYYLRRVTEHLVRSIILLNEWKLVDGAGEHTQEEIKVITDTIEELRKLTHSTYRAYMGPVFAFAKVMQQMAETGSGQGKWANVSGMNLMNRGKIPKTMTELVQEAKDAEGGDLPAYTRRATIKDELRDDKGNLQGEDNGEAAD